METWKAKRNPKVYEAMWGPNEWTCTGRLVGWSTRERLGEIQVPTLVIRGAHDMSTEAVARELVEGIDGAEYVVFGDSSHAPVVEEPERYRAGGRRLPPPGRGRPLGLLEVELRSRGGSRPPASPP